jgi:hypothetical protein
MNETKLHEFPGSRRHRMGRARMMAMVLIGNELDRCRAIGDNRARPRRSCGF